MMPDNSAFDLAKDKNVLFITTKNIDYLRNTQEIRELKSRARRVEVVASAKKSYPLRLLKVYGRLLTLSCRKYDLIFVGFAPQLVIPFWGWKWKGRTVVEDFFISLYDTMVFDRKKFRKDGLIAKLLFRLDQKTLFGAGTAIADTKADLAYFSKTFGTRENSMAVVYLEADTSIYSPRPGLPKPRSPFTVLYFGSILPLQGVGIVLQSAALLAGRADIRFEMIGPLDQPLKERYGKLKNVRFTEWLPQKKLADRIAQADLCLAGHFNGEISKAARTIPGKAYIYRAMEKPMILGDNPANHELYLEDGRTVFFTPMGSAEKLSETILYARERIASDGEEPKKL